MIQPTEGDFINIEVLHSDIEFAGRDGETCPVANAIRRKFPESDVYVTRDRAILNGVFSYRLSPSLVEFIRKFDRAEGHLEPTYGRMIKA